MTATATAIDAGMETAQALGEQFLSITGRVVPYDQPTDVGFFVESFARGAFTNSLVNQPSLPLLRWHDNRTWPIGVAVAWDDRPDGLHGTFRLAMTPEAQLAGLYARDSILTGLSVGFGPIRSSWTHAAEWNPDLGPDHMDHVVRTQARLLEVSITPTPAYEAARIYDVQAVALDTRATPALNNARLWRRQLDAGVRHGVSALSH